MISANELAESMVIDEKVSFKLGVVVELFPIGTAKITFDGEEVASEKEYSYLASYKPKNWR